MTVAVYDGKVDDKGVTDGRLREALRELFLPPADRLRRVQEEAGERRVPTVLDDEVMGELARRSLVRMEPVASWDLFEVGAVMAQGGAGNLGQVVVTDASRAFLAEGLS